VVLHGENHELYKVLPPKHMGVALVLPPETGVLPAI
jgi:hypothetical protein